MNPPERLILFACAAYCFLDGFMHLIKLIDAIASWVAERSK